MPKNRMKMDKLIPADLEWTGHFQVRCISQCSVFIPPATYAGVISRLSGIWFKFDLPVSVVHQEEI